MKYFLLIQIQVFSLFKQCLDICSLLRYFYLVLRHVWSIYSMFPRYATWLHMQHLAINKPQKYEGRGWLKRHSGIKREGTAKKEEKRRVSATVLVRKCEEERKQFSFPFYFCYFVLVQKGCLPRVKTKERVLFLAWLRKIGVLVDLGETTRGPFCLVYSISFD